MATTRWDKFLLLLWKNWIIQKRHYWQTLLEIVIPVLCCSIVLLVRGLADPSPVEKSTIFNPLSVDRFRMSFDSPVESVLAYSPQNPLLDALVAEAADSLNLSWQNVTYKGFANARALESALIDENMLVGIEFDDSLASISSGLPETLRFALRFPGELRFAYGPLTNWQTTLLMVPFSPRLRSAYNDDGGLPSYTNEGFLAVQSALSKAIIRQRDPVIDFPHTFINRIPYPPYYDDPLLEALEQMLAGIILLSFFYPCIVMVKHITIEKERQLKEAMKIMGLFGWLHWAAWFVKNILLLIISISLITILLCVSVNNASVFENSEWTAVWFFFFVYSIAIICFCFMMSVFFNKANLAAGIAGLMWFVFQMPFNITSQNYDEMGTGSKIGWCLFFNSAMSYGILGTMRMEANQLGLRWSSLFTPATIDDGLSVGLVMVMLLVDALIYLLIALYVEQVMPGEFGVAKPWNFLFRMEYWTSQKMSDDDMAPRGIQRQLSRYFEEEPTSAHAGIQIKNLRKVFSGGKVAVQGLNLKMYEDQITVLLGHNGAGKTTTMSMLTGMFSPSSGTAYLNGHDIRTDIEGVRQSMGLCPQHNVLFSEMTVSEHLSFFGRLKGISKANLAAEIDRYLKTLELEDKRHAQSQTLSGGMKRRLAVGIALCGGSKVVLLDEPTSGMDPSARRALWDLLQREKRGRTMLLSTHFMDEADVLGDRIAIMAEGVLKTVGSPFFLKKTFGVGYRLICVKGSNCDKELLCGILRRYIPDVRVETDIGSELSFVLKEDYIKLFQQMLEELETQMERCGITSYGISLTTMEEVFLKAGSDTLHETDERNGTAIDTTDQNYSLSNINLLRGGQLMMNQVKAQFLKKALSTIRSWVQLIIQNLIPVLFVVLTFVMTRGIASNKDLPPLTMTIEAYKQTVTVLEGSSVDLNVLAYQKLFENIGGSHRLDTITMPMNDYILERSMESISEVNIRYLVGATFGENYTAWFNNKAYHTAPLSLSLLYNAVLRAQCPTCELTVVNKPLPFNISTQFDTMNTGLNAGFQLAFNTGFAMAFVAALYVLFYIRERTSRAKLLQYVSGTNITLLWGVAFVWDFAMFVVTCLIYIATIAAFQEEGWSSFSELGSVFLLLIFFGVAFLPTTYLSSFLFKAPATGFVIVMLINIASGSIFFTAVVLLKFPGIDLQDVANGLEWFFMLFPNFVLTHGLNNMNQIVSSKSFCQKRCEQQLDCKLELMCDTIKECCIPELYSFDELGIIRHLITLAIVGIGAFALILAIEYRFVERLLQICRRPGKQQWTPPASEEDSDVLAEKKRVQMIPKTNIGNYNLVMKDLTKYYKRLLAVNKLSVAIDRAECFGLLGINGAGKTTTFKMMTGDESFTSGEAWVKGISLKSSMNIVYQNIGYCPQFDALLEDLTGRETLQIYALLRGVRTADVPNVSLALAEDLNFLKHIDKKVKEYSGGNKRKLSTALALMGNPSVIYLDEPTTGMDPGAKRQFWDMICKVRSAGKSIVLTSHSMEECEALCTRLAIMVNGEFKCLGSTQHLKNKFSKGFLLTIKVKKTVDGMLQQQQVEGAKAFVMTTFNGAVLKEEYQDSLSFHVPQTNLKWSQMFGLMESHKDRLGIEDYALGQTSLEQVFLFFTKYQRIV
ncbi:phospholipid-transporting ATPase ABCA3-like [Topomyia yanbarensis]|uniref:phospholipid-transporting ATPase ABCA3-like n=1 Tax=Topomyia yanbarensis TaxID=2498891 RepID=UPI00273BE4AC|nr:phospholipid-transporting ATPase ABCA3-like [Topomyia yanbarensis]XP_058837018.1 phospholipid-transporting ATPase ABCA3-like [Topomyia yanbarensis]